MPGISDGRYYVAGGTGEVGEGIVRSLLTAGATVVVPARSPEKFQQLQAAIGSNDRLSAVAGDYGTVAGALALRDQVLAAGPLDGVIASIGGWWQGLPLSQVGEADWATMIANNLTSHYATARAFLPHLEQNNGVFVQILGGAAEEPIPGCSLVSITAAGVDMMGRVLAAESSARFRQLQINSFVATRSRTHTEPSWVTADDVGNLALTLIDNSEPSGALKIYLQPRNA